MRVGDLISISRAPAVVSLASLEQARDSLAEGKSLDGVTADLLSGYHLDDPQTRGAFEAMVRSLGRTEARGDAFLLQGVYGAGKSHLLAVIALLAGHPQAAWPAFLSRHSRYARAAERFPARRLVVAIALDEYSTATHPLEHIVLSRLERELARRHGLRLALTEESHLLALVDRYVAPHLSDELDDAARLVGSQDWAELAASAPSRAAEAALAVVEQAGFPLDWRRSRAEAWAALRAALERHELDGPVILLDELGAFLAAKDRRALNADAAFLQYLAQRTALERCWMVGVTQRGLEEVGDVDRRTLRQMRGRFRPGFTLDLAALGWVIEHRLVRRRDEPALRDTTRRLHADLTQALSEEPFSETELARCYPLNPLCLQALQAAAEACLSRTRSIVTILQEGAERGGWLDRPADALITPEAIFDLLRDEAAMSVSGRRHLEAYDAVMANAARIAPGCEQSLQAVARTLVVLGLGNLRWSVRALRNCLAGGECRDLWERPGALEDLLRTLYRRGEYVERVRSEGDQADAYFLDISSGVPERIRRRLAELLAGLTLADGRVARAALEACQDPGFPLAALPEPRSLAVPWLNGRRFVNIVCRDITELSAADLGNLAAALASPTTKEDGWLFLALPTVPADRQHRAWSERTGGLPGRFGQALLVWVPRELTAAERDHLLEHAALARMAADPTFAGRRDRELQENLRARWEHSQAELARTLRRAYHEGRVLRAGGAELLPPDRLAALAGRWEETLAETFAPIFAQLFPRHGSVAPARRLAGRAHTNQIIDEFIRPGQVHLPLASALEAHLDAYARPLGLIAGEGRHLGLALPHRELLAAALGAAPARLGRDQIEPAEVITYGELAGALAKSEWGLREQSELLIAALIRLGYLTPLDAFLQPLRLDAVAAPLGDNLPYLMRAEALSGPGAQAARALWVAVGGEAAPEWDLPTQERAWGDLLAWAARLRDSAPALRALIGRAAEATATPREAWGAADQALARAEAVAHHADPSLTSWAGLGRLVAAVGRLPGGLTQVARDLSAWRACERFFEQGLAEAAALHRLVADPRVRCPQGSLLAREREALLAALRSPERLISDWPGVKADGERWLSAYRRHYLAWHAQVHAAGRFAALAALRQSTTVEAVRRFARAGLAPEQAAPVEAMLARAIGKRCLSGDPLPGGSVICPTCGLALGEPVEVPDAGELEAQARAAIASQRDQLAAHRGLLTRRLRGCPERAIQTAIARLLAADPDTPPTGLRDLLSDPVLEWLRAQLARPTARRRDLKDLEAALRGKELTREEVLRIVEEWLGAGEGEVVEVV